MSQELRALELLRLEIARLRKAAELLPQPGDQHRFTQGVIAELIELDPDDVIMDDAPDADLDELVQGSLTIIDEQ
jgi:hypothetical protein